MSLLIREKIRHRCKCNNLLMVRDPETREPWCPHMDPESQRVGLHFLWQEANELPEWLCKFRRDSG